MACCGSEPVKVSASPVVAIGADAGDKTGAETKGLGMDFSADVFYPLDEDATFVLYRGRDRTRAGPHLCPTRLDESGYGYLLTSVGSRVALASRKAIGTEMS
jgi:hypothetical protein